MLNAEADRDLDALATLLHAKVVEWPPVGGEWDADAVRYFQRLLDDPTFDNTWGARYVTCNGQLVANAGFFGPPDADGEVEIGYSVCAAQRNKGIATATVARLVVEAQLAGATSLRARTTATNSASIRTLERNGFVVVDTSTGSDETTHVLLGRSLLATE
jgi:[ribosomal protein S5]-alanine N-acetyltransferase